MAESGTGRCILKEMVVASVTALQRHWLALTEVRVRQREIPVMRAQLLNQGYDSDWEKPVKSAHECGGVSFSWRTLGFAAVVLDENLLQMKWLKDEESGTLCSADGHTEDTVCVLVVYGLQGQLEVKEKKNEEVYNACTKFFF